MKIENETPVVRSELERAETRQPRARIPFGVPRAKMAVLGEIPGWCLAWINDTGGRIEEARLGGYEFVGRNEITLAVGSVTPLNSDLGNRISMVVGTEKQTGAPKRAYLMKIRVEHKEENQAILRSIREKRFNSIARRGDAVAGDKYYAADGSNPFGNSAASPIKMSTRKS